MRPRRPQPLAAARLGALFFRVGLMAELQYRANFFLQLLQSAIRLGTSLAVLSVIFSHTTELGGWTRHELFCVLGIFTIMGGLIRALIQPNMQRLMEDIRRGTLDFVLTKPEDAQVLVSVREVRIWQGIDVVAGAVILGIGVAGLPQHFGIGGAIAFVLLLMVGAIMVYCFLLMLTTGAFWLVRMDSVQELFDGVYQAGQYPVGIYPGWLRTGLTFLVPLAFAITIPAESLTGRLDASTVVLAVGVAAALLILSRLWFRRGLRRYSGASA